MATIKIENLTFFYPNSNTPALSNLNIEIKKGEFVTVCGPSGSGKTTLLRHLKTALTPKGQACGQVLVNGVALNTLSHREESCTIGFVQQSPENQLVCDKVWHELAFGLESLGEDNGTIRLRVAEMASFFGIEAWFNRDTSQLSGGQKQLLNLASVMAMQPSVLVLDEPTSQLDPIAGADFLAAVGKINRELGVTVILTEHRLEEALPLSSRVIVMDNGQLVTQGTATKVGETLKELKHTMFYAMPVPMRVYSRLKSGLPCPITVGQGRDFLEEYGKTHSINNLPLRPDTTPKTPPAVEISQAWFRYEQQGEDVVKDFSLSVPQGGFYAIVGGNGTGKTTALSLISGVNSPYRGKIRVFGKETTHKERLALGVFAALPQNPQTLFSRNTLRDDLLDMVAGLPQEQGAARMAEIVKLCKLNSLLDRHPYDLSGGEQQRGALAKVLLLSPKILLLDEPTKGLDAYFKLELAAILHRLKAGGVTIIMVSHDIEFCATVADRCGMFFGGGIVSDGTPQSFFCGNSFYTTGANRMSRQLIENAVTVEDVVAACGGSNEPEQGQVKAITKVAEGKGQETLALASQISTAKPPVQGAKPKLSKSTLMMVVVTLLLIPLTLYVGTTLLGDRRYFIISILLMFEIMLPFFMLFEGRRPKARELVVIGAICGLSVIGRGIFFFLPQFKPVAALVIITATVFGGQCGFLVGAISMLASNLFFGQGPWTPFQMVAMGLIGMVAGILFKKHTGSRLALCLYGGVATLVIYGIIMDTYTLFQAQSVINWQMVGISLLAGLPMNLIHAGSTVFFLWVFGPVMVEKLQRIKVKYGIL